MAIESTCSGCGQKLAVPEEHAGKQARCPACGTIYTVPQVTRPSVGGNFVGQQGSSTFAAGEPESNVARDSFDPHLLAETVAGGPQSGDEQKSSGDSLSGNGGSQDEFWMKTGDGTEYGPVDRTNLDRWFSEGRVGPGYQVRQGQNGPWQPANVFQPRSNPYANNLNPYSNNPYSAPAQGYGAAPQYRKADPSGLVLTMGILSWVCILICPFVGFIPGLIAWITGRSGIKDIQAGVADPTNLTLVQVGYYLGMVNVVLTLLGFLAFFGLIAVGVIADM